MSKKSNTNKKRKAAKPMKSKFRKVKVNKDSSEEMLDALNQLANYVFRTRSKFRNEMNDLVEILKKHRVQIVDQVLHDEIKVHRPLEFIAHVKQLAHEGIISYKASEMTRVLLHSCVFIRDITIDRPSLCTALKL